MHSCDTLEMANIAGGPPRFIQPFIPGRPQRPDQASAEELPLMVYLPGIDGTGLAASRQFPFLVDAFDLHCLSIPGSDRTPFPQLISLIECEPPYPAPAVHPMLLVVVHQMIIFP
jgi:hypothetical protein